MDKIIGSIVLCDLRILSRDLIIDVVVYVTTMHISE